MTNLGPALANRFEGLWDASGSPPDVFGFLDSHPTASPNDRLDVILVDQRRRGRSGISLSAEDYLGACPDIFSDPTLKLDLVYGEWRAGRERGEDALDLLATRFPELREPLLRQRLVDDQVSAVEQSIPPTRVPRSSDGTPSGVPGGQDPSCPLPSGPPWPLAEDGRFSIRRQLGAGGMGVVHLAYDRLRGELVALKMMRWADPAALYRFKQEFRALADLAHPNLVCLHELVAIDQQWCFTMELVEGETFLRHVRPEDGPSPDLAHLRDSLAQLSAGLCALHGAGKIHRDLKPSNVLVSRSGRVVVLDFGLVADLGREGVHRATDDRLIGTVLYMSPEQAAGRPVSSASDWYSVGVMLYESLTGRLPFVGGLFEVLRDKQDRDPPSPLDLSPGLPEDLVGLCMGLLSREPETRPGGPELLRRLANEPAGPATTSPGRAGSLHLVGRARHLEFLLDAFDASGHGRTVVACVSGRSGSGKSALIGHFLEALSARHAAVVLAGRCYECESVPYKALDSLIDALSLHLNGLPASDLPGLLPRDVRPLCRVFPVLERVEGIASAGHRGPEVPDPQELRRRAFASLRELLARLGDRRPLVLAIDDLQWGDTDSASLLADLLRPPDPPPLLALASFRSEDVATSPFLLGLVEWRGQEGSSLVWRDLAVEELTMAESHELACSLLGNDDPGRLVHAEVIARESVGNPFFVHELVQSLRSGTPLDATPPMAGAPPAGPIALERVLSDRIARLPEDARRLLEVVCVAGHPIRRGDACLAAELAGEGHAAVSALRSGRLIRLGGGEEESVVEAYHDRIREAVAGGIPARTLADHHRRLAMALEGSGRADAEVLAGHFEGANLPREAAHYFARAADQAASALAFDWAARRYRRALELGAPDAPGARGLRIKLGDALRNAGRGVEASTAFLAAAQLPAPAGEGAPSPLELERQAAEQLLRSGHIDEGVSVLRSVLARAGLRLSRSPRRALVNLLILRALVRLRGLRFREPGHTESDGVLYSKIDMCWSAALGLAMVDPIRGAEYQSRHLLLALRAGDPYRIALGLAMEAAFSATAGVAAQRRSEKISRLSEALAERAGDPHGIAMSWIMRGTAHWLFGRWRKCLEAAERGEEILLARCKGVAWELANSRTFSLAALVWLGEWDEHSRRLPGFLRDARERGDRYAETTLKLLTYSHLTELSKDNPDAAAGLMEDSIASWSRGGYHIQHFWAFYGKTEAAFYRGDAAEAHRLMEENWPALSRSLLLRVRTFVIFARHLRARNALVAIGAEASASARDAVAAMRRADRDARAMERERIPWANPLARLIRAALSRRRGQPAEVVAHLRAAEIGFAAVDMGLYRAATSRTLGLVIGGSEGASITASADAFMRSKGIANPARIGAMYVPGFPD